MELPPTKTKVAPAKSFTGTLSPSSSASGIRAPVSYAPSDLRYLDEAGAALGGWSRELLAIQSDVLTVVGDLERVMRVVVDGAIRAIPHAAGAIVEMQDAGQLVFRAASGTSAQHLGLRLKLVGSLSGHCILTGKPQLCLDSELDARVDRNACRLIGARSLMVAPLTLQGEHVGVLTIYADTAAAFDNRDLLTIQLLAGPIAIGLASAAQAEAARATVEATKRFAATFEQAAVGIAHVSPDGDFLLVNDRFCEIAGHDRAELIAGGFQQITHPDDLEADLGNLAALTAGEIPHYAMEKRYIRKDGTLVWINLTVSIVRNADGTPDFFVSVIEDISARKEAETAASQDALTGLPNRRWLLNRLSAELERQSLTRQPLCVAYLDLDRFKAVNDLFGHAEGDECLIAVARTLRAQLRKDDVVGRMAGDEFVAILPNTRRGDAMALAVRLRQAVSDVAGAATWNVGVSVGGVITDAGSGADAEQVLAAADRVMYGVKRSVGDCQIIDCSDTIEPAA
jgi:diguanylate cyclase (GGDEF)-like protein/PAS domain S-box-containing protein